MCLSLLEPASVYTSGTEYEPLERDLSFFPGMLASSDVRRQSLP